MAWSNVNPFVPNEAGELNWTTVAAAIRSDRERAKRLCSAAGQSWSRFDAKHCSTPSGHDTDWDFGGGRFVTSDLDRTPERRRELKGSK